MRPHAKLKFLILLALFGLPAWANANPIDSLRTLIATADHDTSRGKYIIQLGTAFFNSNLDSAFFYWQSALKLGELLAENENPEISKAGKKQVMRSASNSAVVYQYRGLYPLALKLYQRCLRIAEELKDRRGTMMAYNNIGLIKMGQEKHQEALDYFQKSHKISAEMQDSMTTSTTLNNIGTALKRLKRYDEALAKFRESLVWAKLVGNDDQIVDDLINIGSLQIIDSHFDSAYVTFRQSLALAEEIEYSLAKPEILSGFSECYEGFNQLDSALYFAKASLDTARALDMTEEMIGGLEQLSEILQKLGQYQLAHQTLLDYIHLKDSFFSTSKSLEFGQLEQSFEQERQEYMEAIKAEKDAAELQAKNFKQYLISFATVCLIALLLLLGVRYAKNRRLRYFVVFGALLFFFEFALVLLDNFVDGFTGGLPIPKLLANVLLATLIAPLNIVLERSLMRGKKKTETERRVERHESLRRGEESADGSHSGH